MEVVHGGTVDDHDRLNGDATQPCWYHRDHTFLGPNDPETMYIINQQSFDTVLTDFRNMGCRMPLFTAPRAYNNNNRPFNTIHACKVRMYSLDLHDRIRDTNRYRVKELRLLESLEVQKVTVGICIFCVCCGHIFVM